MTKVNVYLGVVGQTWRKKVPAPKTNKVRAPRTDRPLSFRADEALIAQAELAAAQVSAETGLRVRLSSLCRRALAREVALILGTTERQAA